MLGVGATLDLSAYHPLLRYQPGWLALPLGAVELAVVMGLAVTLDVRAPLEPALIFFSSAWLWAQLLGHAAFPFLRAEYGEDGGELPGAGDAAAAAAVVVLALSGGVAWATRPPSSICMASSGDRSCSIGSRRSSEGWFTAASS
jgi:hypothetical protein